MTTKELRVGPDDWPSAIADTEGHQVVVAGPGTGKTEFLVRRVAHLIESEKARTGEIAVLCFSRRSAAALRRRVETAVGSTGATLEVSTFHSLALRLAEELAEGDAPSPLTTPEQVNLVAQVAAREDPGDWPVTFRNILGSQAFASELADFVMRCSERLMTPADLATLARTRSDWRGLPGLYERYLGELRRIGRTDYAVLISNLVTSLGEADVNGVTSRYRYVLVDEYQDTTPAQARMAGILAREHRNLTVTGDPYQSIYSFRGAELRNIANFSDDHPGARRIVLTQSHRVPEQIMTAALRVVSSGALPGAAGPVAPAPHVGRTEAYVFDQETAEAEWIAEQVQQAIVVDGTEPSRIAVLLRSKRELISELSRALDRRGILHDPPQSRLVDHPAAVLIRDVVTVATLGGSLRNHSKSEAAGADRSMRRILLGPLFAMAIGRERSLTRARQRTWEPWSRIISERVPEAPGLAALLLDTTWATHMTAADGFWQVWSKLEGLGDVVADPDRADWRRAWSSLSQALTRQAERDPSVDLSTYFAMTDDEDFEAEPMLAFQGEASRVALTTLHQAKGLEFDLVFISNASEGVFPDLRRSRRMLRPELLSPERTSDPGAQHLFQVQEEMRLAYTAMTRARKRVVWTSTSAGVDQGERRPSRFLLAAAGTGLEGVGPPVNVDREPVTLAEAETMLRRWLLDPFTTTVRRLAAATTLARHAGKWWEPVRFAGVASPGPDYPLLPETFSLSPSQADAYRTCPRRYALERRLRLGSAESPHLTFGLLIHEVLERAEAEIIGAETRHNSMERAIEILEEVWQTADFGSPELNQAYLAKAIETLERLYTSWPGKGAPVALETHVTTTLGGVDWHGYIDRVEERDGGVAVVDYKTGTSVPSADDVSSSLQLAFYALAWTGDREVVGAEMWFPRGAGRSIPVRRLDLFKLSDVRHEMEEITRAIGEENWSPRVGNHCSKCDFRRSCPAWPEGRGAFLP